MTRQRSLGVVSFVAGLSLFGLASARAQDAAPAGYPPPPADPNAPPPGTYAAAPPPAAPPGAYQPVPMAPPRSPWLILPFLGVQSIQNTGSGTGPGVRIGGIAGTRYGDQLSLNGELVYDVVNYDGPYTGVTSYNIQVAAAPFFHLPVGPMADVVVGPKVGYYRYGFSYDDGYGNTADFGYNGLLLGANAGAFFRMSPMLALGGLVSFDWEKPVSCSGGDGYGAYYAACNTNDSLKMVSVGAGVLF
jgi:hypothetical protein